MLKYLRLFGWSKEKWLASSEMELRARYLQLAKKWHPDRNKSKGAEDKFKQIQAAYEFLKDKSNAYAKPKTATNIVPETPKERKGKKSKSRVGNDPFMDAVEDAVYEFVERMADEFVSGFAEWFMPKGRRR